MPLTVLKSIPASSPADLIRLFHQAQLEWSRHLGEEEELDFGRWISNPGLNLVDAANCLLDGFIVPGTSAAAVIADMDARSRRAGAIWRCCSLNPSMPGTGDLAQALAAAGWESRSTDILYRSRTIAPAEHFPKDLTIIPARASFRHYHQLMVQRASVDADAAMLHLDDSRFDSLLALRSGNPIGCVGVLISGEIGTIREWYVAPDHRQQGIGRMLLNRAMEICSRSVLRHVMIGLPQSAQIERHLCEDIGFQTIGQTISLHRYRGDLP